MSISNRVRDKAIIFNGQKSGLPIEATTIKDGASITNFRLRVGQMEKINGSTVYANILNNESGGVNFISRFKNLILAQRGTSIVCETAEASKSFVTIDSALSSTDKMFAAYWRDRAFLVNGVQAKFLLNHTNNAIDPQRKYGTLGLDPPSLSTNAAISDFVTEVTYGAGVIIAGIYYYTMTFLDSATNSESPAYGSFISDNGLWAISMNEQKVLNGFPGPTTITIAATLNSPHSIILNGPELISYLITQKALNPRITHFAIYRGQTVTNNSTVLFDTFFQVPLLNGGDLNGQTVINIDAFIAENLDFVDNTLTTDLPLTSLPENNYPPPTVARFKAVYDFFNNAGQLPDGSHLVQPFDPSLFSGFRHIRIFRDQLFGIGAFSAGVILNPEVDFSDVPEYVSTGFTSFSDILFGSEVYQPDYYPYIWEVSRGDGQIAVGLGVLGDIALLVFKNRSTHYLTGSSPDNFTLRVMDTQKGCISAGTIQETPSGVICLDRSGFVLFNKLGQGQKISIDIQDVIDSIVTGYADTFYSWYDPKLLRYYCAVVIPGSPTPNLTCCYDLDSGQWTTQKGTEGLSRIMDTGSSEKIVDLMGSGINGTISDFSDNTIVTYNGAQIVGTWTSGSINFGDDQHKKKIQWLYLRAKSNNAWTVDIEIIPDYDESRKYVITDWNIAASQSEWYSSDLASDGSLIWDTGNWAFDGLVRTVSKIPVGGLGYTFQIRIISKETDAQKWGFTIESVSAEAVLMGR